MMDKNMKGEKSRVAYEQIVQRLGKLSYEDLYTLYHTVSERFQRERTKRVKVELKQFRVGERVSFEHAGRTIVGVVERANEKTVSIATAEGGWRIPPRFVVKE